MQAHEFAFEVDATPEEVWRSLHPRLERGVIEHGSVRIEIVHPGDEDGVGLVRHCTFRVPRYLLSGGVGRSWEVVIESRPTEWSRYEASYRTHHRGARRGAPAPQLLRALPAAAHGGDPALRVPRLMRRHSSPVVASTTS